MQQEENYEIIYNFDINNKTTSFWKILIVIYLHEKVHFVSL